MKKKLFLFVAIMLLAICVFAITASAVEPTAEYLETMTSGMKTVTLADNKVVDLYDSEGKALCYYYDSNNNNQLTAIRAEDLVYNFKTETKEGVTTKKLTSIELADGTVLTTTASNSQKTNKLVVVNLRGLDITDFANDNMFKETGNALQHIFMPDTIVSLVSYAFGKNNTLIGCYFSENSNLTTINANTFLSCSSLRGFYLPSGVTTLGGGAFSGCSKLFFVDSASDVLTKPSIYYFPENLTTLSGETLKFCYAMNETIVFGSKVTSIPNSWALAFNDSVKRNVVFTGLFTAYEASDQVKYTTYYFANKEVSFTPTDKGSNNTFYFCSTGTNHLLSPRATDVISPADCENNQIETRYCFCGYEMAKEVVVPSSALGHDFTVLAGIYYNDYTKEGYKQFDCSREACDCADTSTKVNPIISSFKGYSAPLDPTKAGISFGYNIDKDALLEYNTANKTTLKLGVFAVVEAFAGGNSPLTANGEKNPAITKNMVVADLSSEAITSVDFVITGSSAQWGSSIVIGEETTSLKELKFIMGGYVCDAEGVHYIQSKGTMTTLEAVSYSQANNVVE